MADIPQWASDVDNVVLTDYVDNPDDPVEVATQLCAMLAGAGTRVTEQGEFVMRGSYFQGFAALLRQNRILVAKKVKRSAKNRKRDPTDQKTVEEIEAMLQTASRGQLDRVGLGSSWKAKTLIAASLASTTEGAPTLKHSGEPFAVGDIVTARLADASGEEVSWPGKIIDANSVPLAMRMLKPENKGQVFCVLIFAHGGMQWVKESELEHTALEVLSARAAAASNNLVLDAFRIATDPKKWEKTYLTCLSITLEANKEYEAEQHPIKHVKKEPSVANLATLLEEAAKHTSNLPKSNSPTRHPEEEEGITFTERATRSRTSLFGPERYKIGDLVLAKVQGFPPWPGKIEDPNYIPRDVAEIAPRHARSAPDMYCVRFYPEGEYHWLKSTFIQRLLPDRIDKFLREARSNMGPLLEAHRAAQNPKAWEEAHPPDVDIDAWRGLDEPTPEPPDMQNMSLDSDDEDDLRGKSRAEALAHLAGQKRKRGEGRDKRQQAQAQKSVKQGSGTPGPTGGSRRSLERLVIKDEQKETTLLAPQQTQAQAIVEEDKEALKVKSWRWLLQRAFLERGLEDADMAACDRVFTLLEEYDLMTKHALRFSKIPKVMENIKVIRIIPMDHEYHFKARAEGLLVKWEAMMKAAREAEAEAEAAAAAQAAAEAEAVCIALDPKAQEIALEQGLTEQEPFSALSPLEADDTMVL